MEHEAFTLILARFDKVDRDNAEIKTALTAHVEEDATVHKAVQRQSTYWGLLIGLGGPTVAGLIAWFAGLFHR